MALFYFMFKGISSKDLGGFIRRRDLREGFWGDGGLYLAGLIFGILLYSHLGILVSKSLYGSNFNRTDIRIQKATFRVISSSFALTLQLSKCGLGQVKRKTHVSRPHPLNFIACLSFFIIFHEQRFYEQKPTGVTFTLYLFLLCLIQRKLKIEKWRLSASLFELRLKYLRHGTQGPTYPWGKVIMCKESMQ